MKKAHTLTWRLLAVLAAILITGFASYLAYTFDIPNPVVILVVIMIFFTAIVDNISGIASGICIILYALFFFSTNHNFVSFTHEAGYKCNIIVISLVLIYILVSFIRYRKDKTLKNLIQANEQLEMQNKRLENESDRDGLTGLYNRRGGDRKAEEFLKECDETGQKAVLAALDIDDFKNINDTYGHGVGDEALRQFVMRLNAAFPEGSVIIRNGGDEFQLLLCQEDFNEMIERIKNFSLNTIRFRHKNQVISFNISCGYAIYPDQADTLKDLYHKGDVALYDVKMNGKHKAMPYTDESMADERGKLKLSLRSISQNLPVAFLIYKADASEEILMASETMLELCGCESFRDFMSYTGGSFHGFVCPEDLEQVEESIHQQIQQSERKLDEVDYHIITKDGRKLSIHDLGRIIHDPNYGDLFYVVVYDRDASSPT